MATQFYYPHLPNNLLLDILQDKALAASLVHLACHKHYAHLKVVPQSCSIEISNEEVHVSIVLYSGFELHEWVTLQDQANVHLICLSNVIPEMCEFEGMDILFIDKLQWLFHFINGSDLELVKRMRRLKDLAIT